jgi:hypothetical protein
MSITKEGKYYYIQCDNCSYHSEEYDTWEDAKDSKKANGFKPVKIGDIWLDECSSCREEK